MCIRDRLRGCDPDTPAPTTKLGRALRVGIDSLRNSARITFREPSDFRGEFVEYFAKNAKKLDELSGAISRTQAKIDKFKPLRDKWGLLRDNSVHEADCCSP